jgi:hypothetical protein
MNMLGLVSSSEVIGATAASNAPVGRASMSFTAAQIWWLNEALMATLTKNPHRLRELAADPVAIEVAQKALTMKRAVAKDVAARMAKKLAPAPVPEAEGQ